MFLKEEQNDLNKVAGFFSKIFFRGSDFIQRNCDFHELINVMAEDKVEYLGKILEGPVSKKWCEKLSINFDEFTYFMNFLYQQIDLQDL